jgi:hypothetical protein
MVTQTIGLLQTVHTYDQADCLTRADIQTYTWDDNLKELSDEIQQGNETVEAHRF